MAKIAEIVPVNLMAANLYVARGHKICSDVYCHHFPSKNISSRFSIIINFQINTSPTSSNKREFIKSICVPQIQLPLFVY